MQTFLQKAIEVYGFDFIKEEYIKLNQKAFINKYHTSTGYIIRIFWKKSNRSSKDRSIPETIKKFDNPRNLNEFRWNREEIKPVYEGEVIEMKWIKWIVLNKPF